MATYYRELMNDKSTPVYAHASDEIISDILEGRSRYSSKSNADDAIFRLREKVTFSRMSQETGIPTLFIKKFALERDELDQGFRGNFAQIISIQEGSDFVLHLRKLKIPLAKHPDRPLAEHDGECANWAHPFLREVKKHRCYFDTMDAAYAQLNRLQHDYTSTQRLSDGTLRILVYTRRIIDGKPTGKPFLQQATLRVGFDDRNQRPYIFCEYKTYRVTGEGKPHIGQTDDEAIKSLAHFIFQSDSQTYLDITKILLEICLTKEGRTDYKMLTNANPIVKDNDPCVYHFTNKAGLDGIVDTNKLWLTDLRFMNDSSEMRHGIDFAFEAIRESIQEGRTGTGLSALSDEYASRIKDEMLESFRNLVPGNLHRQLFAASFTLDVEQAGAWQTYGAYGSGYAIGFRHKQLKKLRHPDFQYRRVFYHKDRKDAIIKEFFSGSLRFIKCFYEQGVNSSDRLRFWMDILSFFGSIFKHSSWHNEKEWRLMRSRKPTQEAVLKIESRNRQLAGSSIVAPIPYIEGDITEIFKCDLQDVIKEIVVGPGQSSHERSNSVRFLLEHKGLYNIPVRISGVPLSSY